MTRDTMPAITAMISELRTAKVAMPEDVLPVGIGTQQVLPRGPQIPRHDSPQGRVVGRKEGEAAQE